MICCSYGNHDRRIKSSTVMRLCRREVSLPPCQVRVDLYLTATSITPINAISLATTGAARRRLLVITSNFSIIFFANSYANCSFLIRDFAWCTHRFNRSANSSRRILLLIRQFHMYKVPKFYFENHLKLFKSFCNIGWCTWLHIINDADQDVK